MNKEFSLLDFEDDFSEHRKKFFIYMSRTMPHVRKEVHYLPRRKRHDYYETRCIVKIYDTKHVIALIQAKIAASGYEKNIPQWKDHLETVKRITNG